MTMSKRITSDISVICIKGLATGTCGRTDGCTPMHDSGHLPRLPRRIHYNGGRSRQ